jgi:LuxR family transcriptional regulator, maltose regulon positive regulatory protein
MSDERVLDLRLSVLLSPVPEVANGFADAWPRRYPAVTLVSGAGAMTQARRESRGDGATRAASWISWPAQTTAILETKLHAPPLRREWVARSHLVRRLDESAARLILVDAPAGYGKTILLAQWRQAATPSRPFAWVSVDPGDNDPQRLWWHVASSLERACPELPAAGLMAPLRGRVPDISGGFIPSLVNALAGLGVPVVIVLDDYHLIKEHSCHHQLEYLLMHLPAPAAIALSTRADPPLPVGRLRAAGDLAEVRMRELRFTEDAAAELLRATAAVELSPGELSELLEWTEGWPAGIYLAALSLRERSEPGSFVHRFTGSDRYAADFLTEEVINRQPPDIRHFLLHTSVLSRFIAPLCDAVAGTANAADILGCLERANLFVVPLDDNREWYRYHHLFSRVLLSQLARAEPDAVPLLHQRASDWHARFGSAREAIDHALAAGNVTGAIELIARNWQPFVDAGRVATVRGWLRVLGDEQVRASPLAAHCAAWAAALTGDRETVQRWLPVIAAGQYPGPLPDGMRSLQSSAALLVGTFGFAGLASTREAAARAVRLEDDDASAWYGLARAAWGSALYFAADYDAAARALTEALATGPPVAVVRLYALTVMTLVAVEQGRLEPAQVTARAARDLTADPAAGLGHSPQAGLSCIATGAVHSGYGRLAEARAAFEAAQRSRRRWPGLSPLADLEIQLRLAPVLHELGDRRGATALLGQATALLASFPDGAEAQWQRLARLERRLAGQAGPGSFTDPLTERELRVLRLLRAALSLREIGQELHLSVNTIKSHTRVIYRKLGVSSRDAAVARARELGVFLMPSFS